GALVGSAARGRVSHQAARGLDHGGYEPTDVHSVADGPRRGGRSAVRLAAAVGVDRPAPVVHPGRAGGRVTTRASAASEPDERNEPAKRRASETVGSPRGEAPRILDVE